MKKWSLFLFILLIMLAACSETNGQEGQEKDQKAEENVQTSDDSGQTSEDEADKEDSETKEEAEEAMADTAPQYELTGNWSFQPIGDANPKVALLTFDDSPDKHAVEMARLLKEKGAPAIFLVNGHFIDSEEGKQKLKEIYEMGFAIGNHTATHANLKDLTEEQQREEIVSVSDTVEEITGERPKFFRAPFGSNTDFSKRLAEEEGMLVMNWTYGYDWEKQYQNPEALADIMVHSEYLNDGANLLMHDREWTYQALGDIVDGLREEGYELLDPALIQTP
ncbi:UNVERIFIED_CONTAM: polysaccharide deacetylase family protein [Halobacillus marinus]